jgi:hypothetical protein
MYMIVHLRTGVGWNLVALGLFLLPRYLVYSTMYTGLSVGDPDRGGLDSLLGLVGVGRPRRLTLF